MDIQDILKESATRLVKAFAEELRTRNLTKFGAAFNTGQAANSISFNLTSIGYEITGIHYIYELIYGRKPGSQPPLSAIEKWMQEKGLQGSAFPIARAIAEKGTVIFQTHGGEASGLFEETIKKETEIVNNKLSEYYKETYIKSVFD